MNKFTFLLAFFIFVSLSLKSPVYADDSDFWEAPMQIDSAAKSQQKAVTDQEFNKVIDMLTKKKKKKESKKKQQGAPVWENKAPEETQNSISNVLKDIKQDYPTVMLPVTLITPYETELQPGFYRVLSAKNDNGYFINFYQGNTLSAKIKATETGNDYNQQSLNYAKLIPVNDEYMNIIYGDIDCNIEARLRIKY